MTERIMKIARRITEARNLSNMEQKELARRMGIKQQRLSNWESGLNRPSADNIFEMSDALGVSADYLLGLSDDPRPVNFVEAASTPLGNVSDLPQEDRDDINEYIELKRLKWLRDKQQQK